MYYMAIPYILLAALITGYLLYRSRKTGQVTFKVKCVLFNRVNLDLLLSIILVCALCAFFMWSDLKKFNELAFAGAAAASSRWVYGSRIVFFVVLSIVFLARQLERPALRERGISSARWFWPWEQIRSFHWNGTVLQFKIGAAKKQVTETWAVVPEQKQELDRLLKLNVKKQGKKNKKNKPARR